MAARPIVTTGIALVSAGLIAAVPAINPSVLSPRDATLAASDATAVPPQQTLSVEQLRLLALSDITLDELSEVFFWGYGDWVGGTGDSYYPYRRGTIVDGFTGLSYYLTDQFLHSLMLAEIPLVSGAAEFAYYNFTSYFFELGVWEAFRVVASELTGGPNGFVGAALGNAELLGPGAVFAVAGAVLTQATAIVPVLGPDLSYATSIFFSPFLVEQERPTDVPGETESRYYAPGAVGVVNYIIDRILGQAEPWYQLPEEPKPDDDDDDDQNGGGGDGGENGVGGDGGENGVGGDGGGENSGGETNVTSALSGAVLTSEAPASKRMVTLDVTPVETAQKVDQTAENADETTDEEAEELDADLVDQTAEETAEPEAGLKPAKKTKPRLNLKRFNGPRAQTGTAESTEPRTGGKHRAEDNDTSSADPAPATGTAGAAGGSLSTAAKDTGATGGSNDKGGADE